jgi:SNF2 family DNA or RNA helicase
MKFHWISWVLALTTHALMQTVTSTVEEKTCSSAQLRTRASTWQKLSDYMRPHFCTSHSIDKFLIAAGNAEQFDGNASVDKALKKLKLSSLYQPLPGMAISLLPHQTIGVAWALERERSSDKGGCLSDEMGLGKTVQIMSVMVANPSDDPRCKTNLIVAPLALLDQWKLEIDMKTTTNLKCLIYHGKRQVRCGLTFTSCLTISSTKGPINPEERLN